MLGANWKAGRFKFSLAAVPILLFLFASGANAQTTENPSTGQSASSTVADICDWHTVAGGRWTFDFASVKINRSGAPPSGDVPESNIPMGIEGFYGCSGDFSAVNLPLITYIAFAYELTIYQALSLQSQLPEWATRSDLTFRRV